jgi:hypothetical protein
VVELTAWEWPWVRQWRSGAEDTLQRVQIPAGALLRVREADVDSEHPGQILKQVLLVPDLGTAPIVHYGAMLRRLLAWYKAGVPENGLPDVVIAAPNADGSTTRITAWLELFAWIARRHGQHPFTQHVLALDCVLGRLKPAAGRALADDRHGTGTSGVAVQRSRCASATRSQ